MTNPNARHLLVIGAQRSGTTGLFHALDAHPMLSMARPLRPEPKALLDPDVVARGRADYLARWFGDAGDAVVLGEKSTSYIEHPAAALRAERLFGEVWVIAQLRDPIRRAISNWAFSTDNGLETRPLEVALAENLAGGREWDPEATSVSPFAYLERGRYAEQLRAWLDRFGDRVRVQFFGEHVADPGAVDETFGWLGLPSGPRAETSGEPVNISVAATPSLDPELEAALAEYYRDSDDELAEMLGREPLWRLPTEPV